MYLFMNTNDMKCLIELCSCLMSLHLSWITIETLKMNHVRSKQCVFSDQNLHLFHTCLLFLKVPFKLNLLFPFQIHNGTIGIWQLKVQYPSYIILLCLWWEIQGRSIYDRLVIVYETSGQSNSYIHWYHKQITFELTWEMKVSDKRYSHVFGWIRIMILLH